MRKEIKIIDDVKKIIQITTVDERFYARAGVSPETGLPIYHYYPSASWISSYWPKGIEYYKWLANQGWDEANAIKDAAGTRGTRIHTAIDLLEKHNMLPIDTTIVNPDTGQDEQLTTDELECLFSFVAWHNATKPQLIASEMTVFGENYAGSLDRIYRINNQIVIVDFKTSKYLSMPYRLQVSAYSHANVNFPALGIGEIEWHNRKLAILQLGYKLNKSRYKYTEIDDVYDLFKLARVIWEQENSQTSPRQIEYPLVLRINEEKEQKNEFNPSV